MDVFHSVPANLLTFHTCLTLIKMSQESNAKLREVTFFYNLEKPHTNFLDFTNLHEVSDYAEQKLMYISRNVKQVRLEIEDIIVSIQILFVYIYRMAHYKSSTTGLFMELHNRNVFSNLLSEMLLLSTNMQKYCTGLRTLNVSGGTSTIIDTCKEASVVDELKRGNLPIRLKSSEKLEPYKSRDYTVQLYKIYKKFWKTGAYITCWGSSPQIETFHLEINADAPYSELRAKYNLTFDNLLKNMRNIQFNIAAVYNHMAHLSSLLKHYKEKGEMNKSLIKSSVLNDSPFLSPEAEGSSDEDEEDKEDKDKGDSVKKPIPTMQERLAQDHKKGITEIYCRVPERLDKANEVLLVKLYTVQKLTNELKDLLFA